MMVEDTKLRQQIASRFEIRWTENGLIPITMDVHLAILRTLSDEDKSLSSISKAIPFVPASTLYKHLETMIEFGIVQKKRDTVYSLIAPVFMSTSDRMKIEDSEVKVNVGVLNDSSESYMRRMARITLMQWQLLGINSGMIYREFGKILATSYKDYFDSSTVEELVMKLGQFTKENGLPRIIPYSFSPLSMLIEYDTPVSSQSTDVTAPMIGLMIQALDDNRIERYGVSNITMMDGGCKMKVDFQSIPNDKAVNGVKISMDLNKMPFVILDMGGGTLKIITNPNHIFIVKRLDKRIHCIQELIEETGRSRSSIAKDLDELVDKGVVDIYECGTGGMYFLLKGRIVMEKNTPSTNQHNEYLVEVLATQKMGVYGLMYSYLDIVLKGAGVDNTSFWNYLGYRFADFVHVVSDGDPKRCIEIMESCMANECVSYEIIKLLPLTIRFKSSGKLASHGINQFYSMAFLRLFEMDSSRKVYSTIVEVKEDDYFIDTSKYRFEEVLITKRG